MSGCRSRYVRFRSGSQCCVFGNIGIGRSAATPNDIDKALFDIFSYLLCHVGWSLVIFTQAVGKSRIRIGTDIIRGAGSQLCQEWLQLTGTKRTVQAHGKDIGMLHRCQKSIQGLSRQRASADVGHRDREHDGDFHSHRLHGLLGSIDGSLGIQCIKYGFNEQCIYAPFEQRFHLLLVCGSQFVVAQGAKSGIVDVWAHGASLVGGSHRTCHETGLIGSTGRIFVRQLSGQFHGSQVHFTHIFFYVIVGHGHRCRAECVGFDDVCTGFKVFAVNVLNHIGAGEAQQIIVALQLSGNVSKPLIAKIFFC